MGLNFSSMAKCDECHKDMGDGDEAYCGECYHGWEKDMEEQKKEFEDQIKGLEKDIDELQEENVTLKFAKEEG